MFKLSFLKIGDLMQRLKYWPKEHDLVNPITTSLGGRIPQNKMLNLL
jgi:hypothetical protein